MKNTDYYNSGKYVMHCNDMRQKSLAAMERAKEARIDKYNSSPKLCKRCGQPLPYDKRLGTFCTRSCAAVFNNHQRDKASVYNDEWKKNQSVYAKNNLAGAALMAKNGITTKKAKTTDSQCPTCSKMFKKPLNSTKVFCSTACIKRGGFRPTAVRSRYGTYKGIYCSSSWELAFLIYHLDHNSNITRCTTYFPYSYKGKEYRYLPDFEIDGVIYEIKGQKTEIDNIKVTAAGAIMIDSTGMKPYIDYVSSKYKVSKSHIWLLYDADEQKYQNCEQCRSLFIPKRKVSRFCSRSCGMINNRQFKKSFLK